MKIEPFFSIVIPTYNRVEKLGKTLSAIRNQSFSNFEVVIVDDGGNDGTEIMVSQLSDTRLCYYRKENDGPLRARAFGTERAKGHWLAFCDSDDIWREDYLYNLRKIIQKCSCNCVFSEYRVEGEILPRICRLEHKGFFNGLIKETFNDFLIVESDPFFLRLLETQPIMISAYAIKKSFFESIGGIKTKLSVLGSEDSDLTLRASAQGITVYNPTCSVFLGRGTDNISSNYIRNLEGGTEILTNILANEKFASRFSKNISKAIDSQILEVAEQYYWQRDFKNSIRNLARLLMSRHHFIRRMKLILKITLKLLSSASKSKGSV